MPEQCKWPTCRSYAMENGLCTSHNKYYGSADLKGVAKAAPAQKPAKKAVRRPIKKKSVKRVDQEKEYRKILKEMSAESDDCELRVPGVCTGTMQGLHHQKKRGSNYLNRKYLKRACNACNGWCESHPLEAVEMGLSISKLKVQP